MAVGWTRDGGVQDQIEPPEAEDDAVSRPFAHPFSALLASIAFLACVMRQ